MASSYFEVKETANADILSFGLEDIDENGITLSSQLEGDLPKDHTYSTKEPDILQDDELDENDVGEPLKSEKTGRSQRNVKPHKFIKSRKEVKTKKDATPAKKEVAVKTPKKNASKPLKSPIKKTPQSKRKENSSSRADIVSEDTTSQVENGTTDDVDELPLKSKRRGAKKRKFVEEKENVKDDQSPSSDVALIGNSTPDDVKEDIEKVTKKPGKKVAAPVPSSPAKKKKVAAPKEIEETKKKETPKKVIKVVANDKGNGNSLGKGLPTGWIRKDVIRKSGKTAGQVDVYIYSPDGLKFRSKPDVAAYLARTKSNLNIDNFNFSKSSTASIISKPAAKMSAKKVKATPAKAKPEKKSAPPSSPAKKAQKLVVKLKFASPIKKSTKNTKKAVAESSSAKKSTKPSRGKKNV